MTGLRELVEAVRWTRAKRAERCRCHDEHVCPSCATVATAEADLADALLRAPAALEAVEVLVMLGRARAKRQGAVSVTDALDAIGQAENTVNKLADRLAADAKGGA